MPRQTTFEDQAVELPRLQVMVVFFTIGVVFFIATLDTSCVSTALPAIAADLNAGGSVTWVGTALLVASTTSQVIVSRLSDIFGRKICLQVSIVIFAFGNLLCGFAKSAAWLYAARGVAGIGAGGVTSLSLIVITDVVSLRERGKYVSLMGIPTALGLGLGPAIGGALADHVSWRWAFWITVPVAVAAMPIIWFLMPLKAVPGNITDKLLSVDWWGSLVSLAAIVLLLVPISAGGTAFAWSSATSISMLVLGGVLFIVFLLVERRHPLPVVPLHLFKNRTVALVLVTMTFVGVVWFGNFYIAPLYFQNVLGYNAVQAGALMVPLLVGQLIVMTGAGYAMKKWGRARSMILVGYLFWTAGQGMQVAWGVHKNLGLIVGALLIQGIGFGLTSQTTLVLAQASCAPADRAVVTGLRNVFRNFGGAVGLAVSNAIMNATFRKNLPTSLNPDEDKYLRTSGFDRKYVLGSGLQLAQQDETMHAYYLGLRDVYIMYTPLLFACFLFCLGAADTHIGDAKPEPTTEERAIEMTPAGPDLPEQEVEDQAEGSGSEKGDKSDKSAVVAVIPENKAQRQFSRTSSRRRVISGDLDE